MLRKVTIVPPQKRGMTVEIKTGELIQQFNGYGSNPLGISGTTVLNAVAESIMNRWKNKDIITDYVLSEEELNKKPDYTIILSGTRNEESSIVAAELCGLTLMIIPTVSTLTYDLNLEFINNHTHKHYFVKAKNATTTWIDIFLLPALPFFWIGAHEMLTDIADYSYDELQKQGAFIK
jgi:hypothetical protein